MSYQPVSGIVPQYSDDSNQLASGFYVKFYIANTTTPLSMATDSTGGTLLTKAKLNPDGLPISNPADNTTVFIPHVDQDYRLVIYRNEADANANNTAGAFLNVPKVEPLTGNTISTSTGTQTLAVALDDRVVHTGSSQTYQIPTDYPDLQAAIDALSGKYANQSGAKITLNIKAGHALTRGLHVDQADCGNFSITSDDAVVYLDATFVGVTEGFKNTDGSFSGQIDGGQDLFSCSYGVFPRIECLFDMQNKFGTGLNLGASRAFVNAGCGVRNAGYRGLCVWSNSHVQARASIFSGANNEGCRVQVSSTCSFNSANVDDCGKTFAVGDIKGALYVSRSSICAARYVSALRSGGCGILVRRSIANVGDAQVDDCGQVTGTAYGIAAQSMAVLEAINSSVLNSKNEAIECSTGAVINAGNCDLSTRTSAKAIKASGGGKIIVYPGTRVSGSGVGVDTTPSQIIADSNVPALNTQTPDGMIYLAGANGTVERVSPAGWNGTRFADGSFELTSDQVVHTETVATGGISGPIDLTTLLALPSWVSESDLTSVDVQVSGRTSVGSAGNLTATPFLRTKRFSWPIKIKNEGLELNGTSTTTYSAAQFEIIVTIKGTYNIDAVVV